jgi:hypothetical protein
VASTSLVNGTQEGAGREERTVKYMILVYGSQQHYDAMAGRAARLSGDS